MADTTNVELVEDVPGELRLKIYKNAPWTSVMTFYISETTNGGITATKIINIQVCGKETLETTSTVPLRQYPKDSSYTE